MLNLRDQLLPAIFLLAVVGVASYGSHAGMQSWDARERDVEIQHQATHDRYTPNHNVAPPHQTEAAPEQSKEHRNRDLLGPEWFLVWVSIPLAGFTALLFASTRRIATDTKQSSERQLRAYVMVIAADVKNLAVGQTPQPALTIKNSGTTPAHEMTTWSRAWFGVYPPPLPWPGRSEDALIPGPIAPGAHRYLLPSINGVGAVYEPFIAALAAGTHAIYVRGEIRYTDAFGQPRETDFMMFMGGPVRLSTSLVTYHQGNRAT